MKKALFALFIVLVGVSFWVPEACASDTFITSDWFSKYTINSGFTVYNKPVVQTAIGHKFDSGLGGSIWFSLPAIKEVADNKGTEVDLCLWYNMGPLTVGASYFWMFPDHGAFYGNDIYQLNAELAKAFSFNKLSLAPGMRVEYDLPANGHYSIQTTGLIIMPYVDAKFKISEHWLASVKTALNADLGGFGAQDAVVVKVAPRISYVVSKRLTINFGAETYLPVAKEASDHRKEEYVTRIGGAYNF